MRIADRIRIAEECTAIAHANGATESTILPRGICGTERETLVRIEWPELSVTFAIGGVNEPGVLCSFYGAKRDLRHADVFDSINQYHKRKASTYCDSSGPVFMRWFSAMCKDVQSGEVFA